MPANNAKSKHTAAPWELKMLSVMGGPQAIAKTLPGGAEAFICLFLRTGGINGEEAMANARLIQKAPDLLRVLDDVNNALYRVDGDPEDLLRINRSSLDSMTALLDELGGESHVGLKHC